MTMVDLHRPTTEEPTPTPTPEWVTHAEIEAWLASMQRKHAALQTLEATAPQPTLRIRVEHSRTIKDGWSYSTTVEMDGIDATNWRHVNEAVSAIESVLHDARRLGERERDERNQRDTAAKEATAQIASNEHTHWTNR